MDVPSSINTLVVNTPKIHKNALPARKVQKDTSPFSSSSSMKKEKGTISIIENTNLLKIRHLRVTRG